MIALSNFNKNYAKELTQLFHKIFLLTEQLINIVIYLSFVFLVRILF